MFFTTYYGVRKNIILNIVLIYIWIQILIPFTELKIRLIFREILSPLISKEWALVCSLNRRAASVPALLALDLLLAIVAAVLQSLRHVRLWVTPWAAAHQASLSFTHLPELAQTPGSWVSDAIQSSRSLSSPSPPALGPVMPSNHPVLCHPLLLLNLSWHQGLF